MHYPSQSESASPLFLVYGRHASRPPSHSSSGSMALGFGTAMLQLLLLSFPQATQQPISQRAKTASEFPGHRPRRRPRPRNVRFLLICLPTHYLTLSFQPVRTTRFQRMLLQLPGPQYTPALLSTSLRWNISTFDIFTPLNRSLTLNLGRPLKPTTWRRRKKTQTSTRTPPSSTSSLRSFLILTLAPKSKNAGKND